MATEAEQPTLVWTTILKLSKAERPAEKGHCSPTPMHTAALCLVQATSADGKSRASCAADNHIYHCWVSGAVYILKAAVYGRRTVLAHES